MSSVHHYWLQSLNEKKFIAVEVLGNIGRFWSCFGLELCKSLDCRLHSFILGSLKSSPWGHKSHFGATDLALYRIVAICWLTEWQIMYFPIESIWKPSVLWKTLFQKCWIFWNYHDFVNLAVFFIKGWISVWSNLYVLWVHYSIFSF